MKILLIWISLVCAYSHIVFVEKDTEAVIHSTEDTHVDLMISLSPCSRTVWMITPPDTPRIRITNGYTGEYIEPMSQGYGAPGLQMFHVVCSGCQVGDIAKIKLELYQYGNDDPIETRSVIIKVLNGHQDENINIR